MLMQSTDRSWATGAVKKGVVRGEAEASPAGRGTLSHHFLCPPHRIGATPHRPGYPVFLPTLRQSPKIRQTFPPSAQIFQTLTNGPIPAIVHTVEGREIEKVAGIEDDIEN